MLAKLLIFEWKYQLRQTSYVLFSLFFFFMGFYLCVQKGAIDLNRPSHIHLFVGLISLCAVFQLMFQCAKTMLRDKESRSEQIIYSTSVPKKEFLLSRFLGIFTTAIFSSLLYVLGLYLAAMLNIADAHVGESFQLIHFLWPWFLLVIPNIFLSTSLLFGVSSLSKSTVLTFGTGLLLFIGFWINNLYIGSPFTGGRIAASPELMKLISLSDPFGLCASYEQIQFWTPVEKSMRMIQATGPLWINRIIWFSLSLLLLGVTYGLYTFKLSHTRNSLGIFSRFTRRPSQEKQALAFTGTPYFTINPDIQAGYAQIKAFGTLVKTDFKITLLDRKFLVLLLIWVGMVFLAIMHNINGQGVYGASYPTTALITNLILEPLSYLGLFLVIFYAGELVWRSRQVRFHEIIDASPVHNHILLGSKYLVLAMIPAFLIILGIIMGLFIQISRGYYAFNFMLYASLFYYGFLPLVLYAILSICAQNLVSNKYVGMLVSLAIIMGLKFIPTSLGWEHPLFNFFQLPSMTHMYSDMAGFGQLTHTFHAFALLWSAIVSIGLLLSFKLFKRSSEENLLQQLAEIRQNWSFNQKAMLSGLLILALCAGANIYYMLHIINPYVNSEAKFSASASYEKTYKSYQDLTLPELVGVKTKVDLFPQDLTYVVEGNYTYKNTSNEAIDTLLFSTPKSMEALTLAGASLIQKDSWSFEAWLFKLDVSLEPGMSFTLNFKLKEKIAGLETNQDVMENGTYLRTSTFEPRLGYVGHLEIADEVERAKRKLPVKEINPHSEEMHTFDKPAGEKISFESLISTDKDQTALSPGKLIASWTEGERAYFQYKSPQKIDKTIAYFSAEYELRKEKHSGIDLEVYYHPKHTQNIEEIIRAAKATLDYGNKNFAPYPLDHLRIAEVPLHWKFGGQALAGIVSLQERLFTQDSRIPEKEINQLSRVVIHEIGHEWFGHLLSPKSAIGANFLTETMANYTESQVLEKLYGKAMVRRLADFSARRYFKFRSEADEVEPPLYLVKNEIFISYRKGHVVMRALHDLLGEEALNQALANLIAAHDEKLSATSLEFLAELYKVAPQPTHVLIDEWTKQRVRYDLALDSVSYKALDNGQFEISASLFAKRFDMDESGIEKEIDINEELEIGLFPKHPGDMSSFDSSSSLQKVQVCEEETRLKIISDFLPAYIAVDPFFLRLDSDKLDNVKTVK